MAAGVGYLVYMSKNVVVMRERLDYKVDVERMAAVEKRVDAIQKRLEEGGQRIIVGS